MDNKNVIRTNTSAELYESYNSFRAITLAECLNIYNRVSPKPFTSFKFYAPMPKGKANLMVGNVNTDVDLIYTHICVTYNEGTFRFLYCNGSSFPYYPEKNFEFVVDYDVPMPTEKEALRQLLISLRAGNMVSFDSFLDIGNVKYFLLQPLLTMRRFVHYNTAETKELNSVIVSLQDCIVSTQVRNFYTKITSGVYDSYVIDEYLCSYEEWLRLLSNIKVVLDYFL